jgi:hypothetical protein
MLEASVIWDDMADESIADDSIGAAEADESVGIAEEDIMEESMGAEEAIIEDEASCAMAPVASRATRAVLAMSKRVIVGSLGSTCMVGWTARRGTLPGQAPRGFEELTLPWAGCSEDLRT